MLGDLSQAAKDYYLIESAIHYIDKHRTTRPDLADIADSVGLSKYHFDCLFKRWAGISPLRFFAHLSLADMRKRLASSLPARNNTSLVLKVIDPGEYRSEAADMKIRWGTAPSPFGDCLLAVTEGGICFLSFMPRGAEKDRLKRLKNFWPKAKLQRDDKAVKAVVKDVFSGSRDNRKPFHLQLKGTDFQVQVWRALLKIPSGTIISYSDLARLAGKPAAVRAAANAVAVNPVSWLIPCHRVIKNTGETHNYGGGAERKKVMLALEACLRDT